MKATSTRRWLLAGLLLAGLAAPFSGFAQEKASAQARWEKALAEAKKEGKVVVDGPPGEFIRTAVLQGFNKAFPEIAVEYSSGRGSELAAKIKAERDGGLYTIDLILQGTSTALLYFKPIGVLDPIRPALLLPEVTDTKYWADNRLEFADAEQRLNLVFATIVKTPVVYDPKQVNRQEVDELYELLNPKWKGKLVINDPIPSGSGNVTFRFIWEALGAEKATDFFKKIRAQAGAVDRDERRQIESVVKGKYALLLGPGDRIIPELLKRGLNFGVLEEFKDYGSLKTAGPSSLMLFNKAPHPNAATVFVNWLLGKNGQIAWSQAAGYISRRTDVPADHLPAYAQPRSGSKYWVSYLENGIQRAPEEEKLLNELFGR
ncbi:MAG TPA: extracellular solute-binding protein [Candidatus Binatia bacterium]